MMEKIGRSMEKAAEAKSFNFDKRIEKNTQKPEQPKRYDPDRRIPQSKQFNGGENSFKSRITETKENGVELKTSKKERIDQTPKDGPRGEWTGQRGESTFKPKDEDRQNELSKYGMDGIQYKNGIVDFSRLSKCTVKIDMSEKRYGEGGNFEKCDSKCAQQWNKESRDGKSDWTARDVKNWRSHEYTWHERNDRETCDLVPTKVHEFFKHSGGVAECNKANASSETGGKFDD